MKAIIFLAVLVFGCGPKPGTMETVEVTYTKIEGCEYIILRSTVQGAYVIKSITHKGNCKNH